MKRRSIHAPLAVLAAFLTTVMLTGCPRMPSSAVIAGGDQPALMVTGAPEGAVLWVDGTEMGPAADYSTDRSLRLRPGTHVIEVRQGGAILLKETVFLGTHATKTVQVPTAR